MKPIPTNAVPNSTMQFLNRCLRAFLAAVRAALNAAGAQDGKTYGLTLAVWQYASQGDYDLATIASNVDEINIMSYGTGLSLPDCVNSYSNGGFPIAKMIGGIEMESDYSGWGGTVDTLGSDGTIAQKAGYAWQKGLAGMMAWRLDNDYVKDNVSTYQGAIELFNSMRSKNGWTQDKAPGWGPINTLAVYNDRLYTGGQDGSVQVGMTGE